MKRTSIRLTAFAFIQTFALLTASNAHSQSNSSVAANWQSIFKNSDNEFFVDKGSVSGARDSKSLTVMRNIMKGQGTAKSMTMNYRVNCDRNEFTLTGANAFTELNLTGSRVENAAFNNLNVPVVAQPNTIGATYVKSACSETVAQTASTTQPNLPNNAAQQSQLFQVSNASTNSSWKVILRSDDQEYRINQTDISGNRDARIVYALRNYIQDGKQVSNLVQYSVNCDDQTVQVKQAAVFNAHNLSGSLRAEQALSTAPVKVNPKSMSNVYYAEACGSRQNVVAVTPQPSSATPSSALQTSQAHSNRQQNSTKGKMNDYGWSLETSAPNWPEGMYCNLLISINGKFVDKQVPNRREFAIRIDDTFTEDKRIEWTGDAIRDVTGRANPQYVNACKVKDGIWLSELFANHWKHWEKEANRTETECWRVGFAHRGFQYYTSKHPDSETKYLSPLHPVVTEVKDACVSLFVENATTYKTFRKNIKCKIAGQDSICDERLTVNRQGRNVSLSHDEAIVAKLSGENVITVGWETPKGKEERLASEKRTQDQLAEEERKRAWLQTAEGKKHVADEAAKEQKRRAEQTATMAKETAERDAKKAKEKADCLKISGWAQGSRELVGRTLKVSVTSISLIRPSWDTSFFGQCVVVLDTAKGPVKCRATPLFDKSDKSYFADLCMSPVGGCVQALCD